MKNICGIKSMTSMTNNFNKNECIGNEDENVSKQDCEINALKRHAKTLKKRYPKLPICILGDSLS